MKEKNSLNEKLNKKIDDVSDKEEAKKILLEAMKPKCREIAELYFSCLDEKTELLSKKKLSKKRIEHKIEREINPYCLKKFDLITCLSI